MFLHRFYLIKTKVPFCALAVRLKASASTDMDKLEPCMFSAEKFPHSPPWPYYFHKKYYTTKAINELLYKTEIM